MSTIMRPRRIDINLKKFFASRVAVGSSIASPQLLTIVTTLTKRSIYPWLDMYFLISGFGTSSYIP